MTTATPGIGRSSLALPLGHLMRLSDARGIFEHARDAEPRAEHGYCLDDVARALTFVIRESAWATEPTPHLSGLIDTYLRFIETSITEGGAAHNRLDIHGNWADTAGGGDWWGRGVGALGATARLATDPSIAARATHAFLRGIRLGDRRPARPTLRLGGRERRLDRGHRRPDRRVNPHH